MFNWNIKEAPFFTGIARGVGGAGFGKAAGGGATAAFSATGGTLSLSRTGYRVHTFTPSTPSVFQWNATSSIPGVEYLVIGGGGAGGDSFMPFPGYNSGAGGGGAGGMRSGTLSLPSSGSFTVSVGPAGESSGWRSRPSRVWPGRRASPSGHRPVPQALSPSSWPALA